jgi:hypothetical protein
MKTYEYAYHIRTSIEKHLTRDTCCSGAGIVLDNMGSVAHGRNKISRKCTRHTCKASTIIPCHLLLAVILVMHSQDAMWFVHCLATKHKSELKIDRRPGGTAPDYYCILILDKLDLSTHLGVDPTPANPGERLTFSRRGPDYKFDVLCLPPVGQGSIRAS